MNDPVVSVIDCDVIKCSNCNKDLLIIKNKKADTKLATKLQVMCPYCNDKSFTYETKGSFGYHPVKGLKITSYSQKDDIMKFITTKGV